MSRQFGVVGETEGVSQVVAHRGLVLFATERLEQGKEALECLAADLFGQFLLDPARGGPLRG
jgi:hypothetical protein